LVASVQASTALKVAIYIRVSTKLQEERYSLSAQREELTRYAMQQGWQIVDYYKDVDSGGKLDKQGLNQLLDDVEDDKIDVVLCVDQDRLSRLDTVAWEYLKDILRSNNVKIAEPGGKVTDLKNEDDEFISDIYNLIARREKRAIVRRMMRGARQRTRQGRAWGRLPVEYLFDEEKEEYTINDKWAWVIPYIDKLYLEENMGYRNISNKLNEICLSPEGKSWTFDTVKFKLTSKAYHGVVEVNFSGETVQVPDIFPKLRSEETYNKIEAKRAKKHRVKPRSKDHLISDIDITCALCGKKLGIQMGGNKNHYYLRHARRNCKMFLNVFRVEKNLVKAIKEIAQNEELAKQYLKLDYSQQDMEQLNEEIKQAKKTLKDAKDRLERLLDLYLDGNFSKEQLDKRKSMIEQEVKVHEDRQQQLEIKKKTIEANMFTYDTLAEYFSIAERFQTELTLQEQMKMVSTLFPKALLDEKKFTVYGELPGGIPLEIEVPVSETL
jgi:site-specific DNA recombinase